MILTLATPFLACSSMPSELTVKLLHSSCNQNKFQPTIQLHCLISNYIPGDLEVTWLRDGQQIGEKFTENSTHSNAGMLASTQREFNITQSDWASESTFTCQVLSQGRTTKAHIRKCTGVVPLTLTPRLEGGMVGGAGRASHSLSPHHR